MNVEDLTDSDSRPGRVLADLVTRLIVGFEDSEIAAEFRRQLEELQAQAVRAMEHDRDRAMHIAFLRRRRRARAWTYAMHEMRRREMQSP